MIVLTVILILLLVALLSDLGQGARDWVADLWNSLAAAGTESASLPHDAVDGADAATAGAEGGTLTRVLSSLPKDADGAVAAAAYRGQAAGAGQVRRASGSGGPIGGASAGATARGAVTTGESAASDAGAPPVEGPDAPISALALADTVGGGAGGGAAASGGGEFGGNGPFSTVPGGPFVNLTSGGGDEGGSTNDNPNSSVPEPGTLLLLASAAAALGVRRYWRG